MAESEFVAGTQEALSKIETLMQALQEQHSLRKIQDAITPIENAQLNSELAFTLNSLYFAFLRVNGFPTQEHKIMGELTRVKRNMVKVKQVGEGKPSEQEQQGRNFSINSEAAGRMIQHQIGSESAPHGEGRPAPDVQSNLRQQNVYQQRKR